MHSSRGRCGRSHIRVGRSSQRITLPFAILTMEVPTEVALVTTRHDIFDTEAMWKCMEEGGVMWCEVVAAARAAGTSVVEHQSSIAEKRLERARQRLDEIELEKVARWRSGCGCAVSWATFLIKSGRDVKQGVRGSESATSIW